MSRDLRSAREIGHGEDWCAINVGGEANTGDIGSALLGQYQSEGTVARNMEQCFYFPADTVIDGLEKVRIGAIGHGDVLGGGYIYWLQEYSSFAREASETENSVRGGYSKPVSYHPGHRPEKQKRHRIPGEGVGKVGVSEVDGGEPAAGPALPVAIVI